jgi:hypothetical protein
MYFFTLQPLGFLKEGTDSEPIIDSIEDLSGDKSYQEGIVSLIEPT